MKLDYKNIHTLGELKAAGYQTKSVKDELRDNLVEKIKKGEDAFPFRVLSYVHSCSPVQDRTFGPGACACAGANTFGDL